MEDSLLISVLSEILERLADKASGQLSSAQSRLVRLSIRDHLKISDSPSSRDPDQIAEFVYWNCWSLSRAATERWLASLPEKERDALGLGEVLETLLPGLDWQMNLIADKNEGKLFYITGGGG